MLEFPSKVIRSILFRCLYEREVQIYKPASIVKPPLVLEETSTAWKGLDCVIGDIMDHFEVGHSLCIEFGVEFGFSTVALSNFFEKVIGVDTFLGDIHTSSRRNHFEETSQRLSQYRNIQLVRSDYQTFIQSHADIQADLIHVDIVHDYKHTYQCGLWSAQHSRCTLFHDTDTFPAVRWAVRDVARKCGKTFYNYPHHCGLGIVV